MGQREYVLPLIMIDQLLLYSCYRLTGKTLWEMNPTSMRNKVKLGVFDGKTMRNAVLEIISHCLFY